MPELAIEENIKNLLNVSIGLLRAGEESLQAGLKNIASSFEEVKKKGVDDHSQGAEKMRELLNNTVTSIQKLSKQAQGNMEKISAEAQKAYEQVLSQVRSTLGEEQYDKLNSKLQEFYGVTQSSLKDVQKTTNEFIGRAKESASKVISA